MTHTFENELLIINIEDKKFMINKTFINNYPNSRLAKIINKSIDDKYVIIKNNNIYINKDPEVFMYILDMLKGYELNMEDITDNRLKNKIISDLRYFGLYDEFQNQKSYTSIKSNPSVISIEGINQIDIDFDDIENIEDMLQTKEEPYEIINNNSLSENIFKFDTNVLKSNNSDKINEFIKSIDEQLLAGNSLEVITSLSNDPIIKNILINNLQNIYESDAESIEDLNNINSSENYDDKEQIENFSKSYQLPQLTQLPKNTQNINSIDEYSDNYKKVRTNYIQINQ